jgi:hypothetical protein
MIPLILPQNNLYLPTDTPNLIGWWSALDPNGDGTLPSDGSGMSIWKDKSGNGHDISQSTTALKPTFHRNVSNGKPAVLFDNSFSQFLYTSVFEPGSPFTGMIYSIQIIYQPLDLSTAQSVVYNGNANANGYGLRIESNQREIFLGGEVTKVDLTSPPSGDFEICSIWWDQFLDGGVNFMTVNGSFESLSNNSPPFGAGVATGTFSFGFNTPPGGGGQGFWGYIQEVLFYNRTLSAAEIRKNEIYLSQVSGIALT